MSDHERDRRGMCAAYGCPLFGSMSNSTQGDAKGYFACHIGKSARGTDEITMTLRDDSLWLVVLASLDIREYNGTDQWQTFYRPVPMRLVQAERRNILPGDVDASDSKPPSVRSWLRRLKTSLVHATYDLGEKRRKQAKTVKVVGPTHIVGYFPYIDGEVAA